MQVPDYILDTEPDDDLDASEQEYWETYYRRQLDEANTHYAVGVHIGKMAQLTAEMDAIAEKFPKPSKYVGVEDIF